uniref:C2H2-type domain-containing protein n=1 Tax=Ditylum brightwellii TaxID=49249 RepID=A0A7S1ZR12_9STRA|mmetsp:Transcript_36890/g.55163  ORF Transcript_36890/g.55163 Transcript_36890/m.55163 type:complete len:1263 (+) Transcript_36890:124-3912(+)
MVDTRNPPCVVGSGSKNQRRDMNGKITLEAGATTIPLIARPTVLVGGADIGECGSAKSSPSMNSLTKCRRSKRKVYGMRQGRHYYRAGNSERGGDDLSLCESSDGMLSPSPRSRRKRDRGDSILSIDASEEYSDGESSWWIAGGEDKGDMRNSDAGGEVWRDSRSKTPPSSTKRLRVGSVQSLMMTMEAECGQQVSSTDKDVCCPPPNGKPDEKPIGIVEPDFNNAAIPSSPCLTASSRLSPISHEETNQYLGAGDTGRQKAMTVGPSAICEPQSPISWDSEDVNVIRRIQQSLAGSTDISVDGKAALERAFDRNKVAESLEEAFPFDDEISSLSPDVGKFARESSADDTEDIEQSLCLDSSIVTPCGFCFYNSVDERWDVMHRPLSSRFNQKNKARTEKHNVERVTETPMPLDVSKVNESFIASRCASNPVLVAHLEHESCSSSTGSESPSVTLAPKNGNSMEPPGRRPPLPPPYDLVKSILKWSELADIWLLLRDELISRGFSKRCCTKISPQSLCVESRQGEKILLGSMFSKYLNKAQKSCRKPNCHSNTNKSVKGVAQCSFPSHALCFDDCIDILSTLVSVASLSTRLYDNSTGKWRINYPCPDTLPHQQLHSFCEDFSSIVPSKLHSEFANQLVEKCFRCEDEESVRPNLLQPLQSAISGIDNSSQQISFDESNKADNVDSRKNLTPRRGRGRPRKDSTASSNGQTDNTNNKKTEKKKHGKAGKIEKKIKTEKTETGKTEKGGMTEKTKKVEKKKGGRELAQIQRDEGGTASADRDIVQLFASDFNNRFDPNLHGRSKRKIKSVVRFDATPLSSLQQKRMRDIAGKTGNGFICPQCSELCPYDARECNACHLPCRYVAGTGVVVCRERNDVTSAQPSLYETGKTNHKEILSKTPKTPQKSVLPDQSASKSPPKADKNKTEKTVASAEIARNNSNSIEKQSQAMDAKSTSSTSLKSQKQAGGCGFPVEDCEVCFEPFPAGKACQKHRKLVHGLDKNTFGCPYCSKTYKSMIERRKHVIKFHPKKPWKVSQKERDTKKLLIYTCHLCGHKATGHGIRSHYRALHQIASNTVLDKIRCLCPFCLDKNNEEILFKTEQDLLAHMAKSHSGCIVIERSVLNLGGDDLLGRCSPQKKQKSNDLEANDEKEIEKQSNTEKCRKAKKVGKEDKSDVHVLKQNWNKLDFAPILYACDIDTKSCKDTEGFDKTIEQIDVKCDVLQRTLESLSVPKKSKDRSDKSHAGTEEEEYLEEWKVFHGLIVSK